MAWQKVRIPIPEDLSPQDRLQVGKDIIDFIIDRTEQGFDKNNKKFPKYSKEYVQSLEFKIAGKGRNVNLKLSGDMLAALQVISTAPGSVLIGFENGSEENDRAEGNILGSYGGDPDRKKARDFLGIKPEDLESILAAYG